MIKNLPSTQSVLLALLALSASAKADETLQWQSFAYSDLQGLQLDHPQYKEAWVDRITANNLYYRDKHDLKYSQNNAPATEAHFYVSAEAQQRTLLVTVINSAEACKPIAQDPESKTTLKTCPVRLVMQDHKAHSLTEAGTACLVEYGAASNTSPADILRNAMYGTYDRSINSIRLNVKFNDTLQDQCAVDIPLPTWPFAGSPN